MTGIDPGSSGVGSDRSASSGARIIKFCLTQVSVDYAFYSEDITDDVNLNVFFSEILFEKEEKEAGMALI